MAEQKLREQMNEDRWRAEALLTLRKLKVDHPEEMMQKLEGRYGAENTMTVIELAGSPDFLVQNELRAKVAETPNVSLYDISSPKKILTFMAEVEPRLTPGKMADIAEISKEIVPFEFQPDMTAIFERKRQEKAEQRFDKFKNAEGDMFNLIACMEGLPAKVDNPLEAYEDETANVWTIGFGNTYHPDGSPVKKGDKITSKEDLQAHFNVVVEHDIFPLMDKYLDISKMTQEEIVAVASLCYNCGPGILGAKGRYKPSELSKALNQYFTSRNDVSKQQAMSLMAKHCRVKGNVVSALVYRRDFEGRIFAGDVPLSCLDEVPVGSLYSVGKKRTVLPHDSESLVQAMMNERGRTVPDTVTWALNKAERANAPQVCYGRKKSNTGR